MYDNKINMIILYWTAVVRVNGKMSNKYFFFVKIGQKQNKSYIFLKFSSHIE